MNRFVKWVAAVPFLAVCLVAGCSHKDAAAEPSAEKEKPQLADAKEKYLLAGEPAGAKGVIQARNDARDGEEVVVVGRIGGDAKPWVDGRASFWIVDTSVKSCKETEDDNCPTPWDFCCTPKEDLVKAMATVKVVDEQGRTVQKDARALLGVKELQTVVIRAQAKRDENGNLTLLAAGVYARPEGKK
jgi:hypothetical protein